MVWRVHHATKCALPAPGSLELSEPIARVFAWRDSYFGDLVPEEFARWSDPGAHRDEEIEKWLARIAPHLGNFIPCGYFPIMKQFLITVSNRMERAEAMDGLDADEEEVYVTRCVKQIVPLVHSAEAEWKGCIERGWNECVQQGCGMHLVDAESSFASEEKERRYNAKRKKKERRARKKKEKTPGPKIGNEREKKAD